MPKPTKVKTAFPKDIARKMAAKLNIPLEQAVHAVRAFMEATDELLLERTRVTLTGFCTFSIFVRPAGMYKRYVVRKGESPEEFLPDRPVPFVRMSAKVVKRIKQLGQDPDEMARIIDLNQVKYDKKVIKMKQQAEKREMWRIRDAVVYNEMKKALLEANGITDVEAADLSIKVPKGRINQIWQEIKANTPPTEGNS